MFSVVEVTGPVFYRDWSGRLVEIRANDSLTKEDLISSLSAQRITLKSSSGDNIVINTSEPKSVEELLDHADPAPSSPSRKTSLPLKALINNHFKGSIIEDEGIGACGHLQSLDASVCIAAQTFEGKFGSIDVRDSGEWVYFLNEAAMDGELTTPWSQFDESFALQAMVDQNPMTFEFMLQMQGTEDIPDIIGANICSLTDNEANNSGSPRQARAEHEIMSMIAELLMTK